MTDESRVGLSVAWVVYKYRLRPAENLIEMPPGAQLLHVASQGSEGYVWALHDPDPDALLVKWKVVVVPTGVAFTVDAPLKHIGTFTIREPDSPELVFHAFDCGFRDA